MSLPPTPRDPHGPLGVFLAWVVALGGMAAIVWLIVVERGA
jgi:hypothetical protein